VKNGARRRHGGGGGGGGGGVSRSPIIYGRHGGMIGGDIISPRVDLI